MVWIPGVPEEAIVVVLASNLACFKSTVPIPEVPSDVIATWIVLIVAATPAFGIKSTIRLDPEIYGLYVPNPDIPKNPGLVVTWPYSVI